jgi:hypothetical protein
VWGFVLCSIGMQKIQDLLINSLFMTKKLVFGVQWVCAMRCNNCWAKTPESKGCALLVYWLTALAQEGNILSICCSTGEFFINLSNSYYHSKSCSCFLNRLLNLPKTWSMMLQECQQVATYQSSGGGDKDNIL